MTEIEMRDSVAKEIFMQILEDKNPVLTVGEAVKTSFDCADVFMEERSRRIGHSNGRSFIGNASTN